MQQHQGSLLVQGHLSAESGAEGVVGGLGQRYCAEHAWPGLDSTQECHG